MAVTRLRGMSKAARPSLLLLPLLFACGGSDPVADNAVAPSDTLVGDASATGLAAPGNSSAAEAAQRAALPMPADAMRWTYRSAERIAEFGPPGSPAFAIQCQRQREGQPQLIFVRHVAPAGGGEGTLSFTGNGQAASLPVRAVINPGGVGGQWRATVAPDDHARDVAEAFAGPGPIEINVGGASPLVVAPGAEPRRVLADCLRG